MKPSDEFTGAVIVHNGLRDHQMDWPWELVTDAPSVTSAGGFQDLVAEAAQNQGLRYQSGCIIFNKKNRLDGHAVVPGNISGPDGDRASGGGEFRMLPLTRSPRQGQ
jgi:hypothetical protein